MQITIDLPPDLEQDLLRRAAESNIPLQTLIVETLRQSTQKLAQAEWSELVLSHVGIPDFPAFESYRDELLSPDQPELF